KRSLLLSFAKQGTASTSAISSRCRSTQMAKTSGNVPQVRYGFACGEPGVPARRNPSTALRAGSRDAGFSTVSNLPFDGCNAFLLYRSVVAKPGEPMYIGFSPEPCELALGIVTMRLLRRAERRFPIQFAAQKLHRLRVSQRRERARLIAIFCEKPFRLGDQSLVKHFLRSLIDAGIKSFALWIESQTQDAKTAERFASLLPKFGHSSAKGPAKGRPRGQAHLDCADHLGNVMGVYAARGRSVEPP